MHYLTYKFLSIFISHRKKYLYNAVIIKKKKILFELISSVALRNAMLASIN